MTYKNAKGRREAWVFCGQRNHHLCTLCFTHCKGKTSDLFSTDILYLFLTSVFQYIYRSSFKLQASWPQAFSHRREERWVRVSNLHHATESLFVHWKGHSEAWDNGLLRQWTMDTNDKFFLQRGRGKITSTSDLTPTAPAVPGSVLKAKCICLICRWWPCQSPDQHASKCTSIHWEM